MKGLLYRKFASSRAMLLFFLAIFVVSAVLKLFQNELFAPFSVDIYMVYAAFMLVRGLEESDKSSWESYARALPCKASHRVGAEYLFGIIVFTAVFVTFSFLSAATRLWGRRVSFGEKFVAWAEYEFPLYLLYFAMFVFSTALVLPIKYAMKKSAGRSALMALIYFLPFISLISMALFSASGDYEALPDVVMTLEFAGMLAAVSVLAFGASFCFSVIYETKIRKEKLRPVKVCAAVLTAVAIAFSGIIIGDLYAKGAFEKVDYNNYVPEEPIVFSEEEKRTAMLEITEKICGKTFVDKTSKEAERLFEEMGFYDEVSISPYEPETRPANIYIERGYSNPRKGYPMHISITSAVEPSVVIYPDSPETFDDAERKHAEVMELFKVGTREEEALEHIKSLGLCPNQINESTVNGIPMRSYHFEIKYYSEYKKAAKPKVNFSFKVTEGRISDVG